MARTPDIEKAIAKIHAHLAALENMPPCSLSLRAALDRFFSEEAAQKLSNKTPPAPLLGAPKIRRV